MKSYYYGFILAIQFFSVVPISVEVPMNNENIERSIRLFPLLGLFLGMNYAGVGYVLITYTSMSNLLVAFIIWLLGIVLTGGIHLDGWMDTADAFFSYRDSERRLEIMADPRIGAFGVIGAIVFLLAKFIFIFEVVNHSQPTTFWLIMLIPLLSRALMGGLLSFIPNAKEKGLGKLFQSARKPATMPFYLVYLVALIPLFMKNQQLFVPFILLLLVPIVSFFLIKRKVIKWFGGTTGDVIGAGTEGVELLLWMMLLVLQSFGMV